MAGFEQTYDGVEDLILRDQFVVACDNPLQTFQYESSKVAYLVFVEFVVDEFVGALLLERDDDERHEDVDEEEWKHDEVDDVEDGHLHAIVGLRTLVLVRRIHRVDQHAAADRMHQQPRI